MTRRTVSAPARIAGVGLHLGQPCELTFRPAAAGEGIRFRRVDLADKPVIPARVDQVTATERRTQLGSGAAAIHTVEHVLSAVAALEIDDLMIDMSGPEPPILDGSAAPFYDALIGVGIEELPGEPEYLTLTEPLRVIDGNSVYEAHPANELLLDVTIEFPHPVIGRQSARYVVGRESYRDQMAAARTFGFLNEVEDLRAKGLIQGASTDNAVVLDDTGVVANVLRWDDEFLRHKALDCVGDLALVGSRVKARIVAVRPSHRGTVTLVREMVRAGRRSRSTEQGAKSMAGTMSIEEIMKVLPHRYPFLLIDRILEIEGKQRIVGMKNVTINEPFFQGHFPGHPIMPGVLIIEAMAQVGGMLLMGGLEETEQKVVYFMSLDNVRFRKPVRPGDQIRFELDVIQIRGAVCKMRGVAKVDGELVAEAEMAAMVRDR
ncbi:MAG TPA: bifunctional UDP-3-O-[3-hydroxymyristoyl] N-acetylglucosamine deacetylase/3-hydroxyacyl-ACP dehydratase [Gemmatimonadaceae bacterium]|nr:bifunctional UDP-3-O-[3-hydroxymyristoyl] N-acetylglucosamine deacetylase/3-hydroxyacyl-ACP dehydratase [Gemmatimonadaceae bacterium]